MSADNIIVLALGKSGTTAFHNLLLSCKPKKTWRASHEPVKLPVPDEKNLPLLVKANLESCIKDVRARSRKLKNYEKKILLVRNPRDRLISAFMYRGYDDFKRKSKKEPEIQKIINALKDKSDDPSSISMQELLDLFTEAGGRKILAEQLKFMAFISQLVEDHPEFYVFQYEDMMKKNFDALSDYLGFKVDYTEDISVGPRSRIIRSKTYDDWKNWFTPSDVKYFNKEFLDFDTRFGYLHCQKEKLNKPQVVKPRDSWKYFMKMVKG
jgi:hypothetical protein